MIRFAKLRMAREPAHLRLHLVPLSPWSPPVDPLTFQTHQAFFRPCRSLSPFLQWLPKLICQLQF